MHLAIVDDDKDFGTQLAQYLSQYGFQPQVYLDAEDFFAGIRQDMPDLVVLDQLLDGESGLDVLRRLRVDSAVPCIILTGLGDEIDRVVGLEIGADDYVGKHVRPREILARIRAVLRRSQTNPPAAEPAPAAVQPAEASGRWTFQPERRELNRPDGRRVLLTTAEFELMRVLFNANGAPVNRETLYRDVLGRTYRAEDRAIDNLVAKLRRKIEQDPSQPALIKTVRPFGYVLIGFEAPATSMAPQRHVPMPALHELQHSA